MCSYGRAKAERGNRPKTAGRTGAILRPKPAADTQGAWLFAGSARVSRGSPSDRGEPVGAGKTRSRRQHDLAAGGRSRGGSGRALGRGRLRSFGGQPRGPF